MKPGVLTSKVLGKNHVEITTAGYMLEITTTREGLHVFVYQEETMDVGCVAMAYDPIVENGPLHLTGDETP